MISNPVTIKGHVDKSSVIHVGLNEFDFIVSLQYYHYRYYSIPVLKFTSDDGVYNISSILFVVVY